MAAQAIRFAALALLFTPSVASADLILTWKIEDGGNGHAYGLILPASPPSWTEAQKLAGTMTYAGMPGHLVTVNSAAENAFLETAFRSSFIPTGLFTGTWAWIGLTDRNSEGNFEWITGEPFIYSNWHPLEPNNLGEEDFAAYWLADGLWSWNDSAEVASGAPEGTRQVGFIVEFQPAPEPASLGLMACGAATLIWWSRRGAKSRGVSPTKG